MDSRIRVFTGHFGSGKTEIAINYAMNLRNRGLKVCIADLDIVNHISVPVMKQKCLRKKE
jgi:Mrp family chromosome partitioning ATPase